MNKSPEGMVFGCMTPEEQRALHEAKGRGEIIECVGRGGWQVVYEPHWFAGTSYRIAPAPVEPFTVDPIVWQVLDKRWRWITGESDGMAWMLEPKPSDMFQSPTWVGTGAMTLSNVIAPGLIQRGTCRWEEAIAERPEDTP